MSDLVLTRIASNLDKQFGGKIDMKEWEGRPTEDRRRAFLSKAVAALCVKGLAGVDIATSANAVTDGFHDNDVDAVYFDQKSDTLFIVQSKWSNDGTKPLDAADATGLANGARDLLAAKFDRFNEKMKKKEPELLAALYSDRPITITLVTAHTATQAISPHTKGKVDDLIDSLNDSTPIANAVHLNQAGVYGLITSESKPASIKLQITLRDWGLIKTPFQSYYGRVHVSEINQWWSEHRNGLFTQNLRLFYPNSEVNDALLNTLMANPEFFWYFNNGITVICDTLQQSIAGSPERLIGLFTCHGANIVNGAQTVGTIGKSWGPVASREPGEDGGDAGQEAWVQVRIISLEKCPPAFSQQITRAANLQNAVGNREFAAMDPVQHRLATEFALDKRRYVYKQGESDPKGAEGCDIVEATQALACSHSVDLAVLAKRELGSLWADTSRSPYTDLFNERLTSTTVWRSVQIMRAVEDELQRLRRSTVFGADLIAVHLNRLILHLVFEAPSMRALRHDGVNEENCIETARVAAEEVFPRLSGFIEAKYKDNYLASLSKNLPKCSIIAQKLLSVDAIDADNREPGLFDV